MAFKAISFSSFFTHSGQERIESNTVGSDVTQFFEKCGDFGYVELETNGDGVLLDLEQLRMLRERGNLNEFCITRQENGKYLVTISK